MGNLLLVFHPVHRPVISLALFMFSFSVYRLAGNRSFLSLHRLISSAFAFAMRWANSVSLYPAAAPIQLGERDPFLEVLLRVG